MSKTEIIYRDIAPGAAEDSRVTATGAMVGSNIGLLPFGTEFLPLITLERDRWLLDGSQVASDGRPIAYWSEEMSGDDCTLQNPPVITISLGAQYSSVGITFRFSPVLGDQPGLLHIDWYQGSTKKDGADFTPTDGVFFCQRRVQSYDKIVITVLKTWLPRRRVRLDQAIFGIIRVFGMENIRAARMIHEMDLISSELPISTLDWTLDDNSDVDYMFQLKQPIEVRNNDNLLGVFYIDAASRKNTRVYELSCYNAFGTLDETVFTKGVYTNKSAKELAREIVGTDFAVVIDDDVPDLQLTGIIRAETKREALRQVLFAWGMCAATDGMEAIHIFKERTDVWNVPEDDTYVGVTVETAAVVTEVQVKAYTYTQDNAGTIEINGVKYREDTQIFTVTNPDVTATDKPKIIEIVDATLVSPAIGQQVAQRVYDYYQRRQTNSSKIVWRGQRLGEAVTVPNSWGGTNTGNLRRLQIILSNTVAAECETVGT